MSSAPASGPTAMPRAGRWISPARTTPVGSPPTKQPHRSVPPEIEDKMLRESFANTLLEDWEGIEVDGFNGSYSPDAGVRAMADDPAFEALIVEISLALAEDRRDALAEDAETLGNGSGGGSNTEAARINRRGSKAASAED